MASLAKETQAWWRDRQYPSARTFLKEPPQAPSRDEMLAALMLALLAAEPDALQVVARDIQELTGERMEPHRGGEGFFLRREDWGEEPRWDREPPEVPDRAPYQPPPEWLRERVRRARRSRRGPQWLEPWR